MYYFIEMETYDEIKIAKQYMPIILRRYRNAAGLSQQQLVNIVGISKGFYSLLERGLRAPNLDLLVRIAKALKVRPGEMLDAMVEESER